MSSSAEIDWLFAVSMICAVSKRAADELRGFDVPDGSPAAQAAKTMHTTTSEAVTAYRPQMVRKHMLLS
jgi:hypothetical protein